MTTPRPDTGTTDRRAAEQPTEPAESDAQTTETPDGTPDTPEDAETFPRAVVEELRRENAEQRTKAKRADDLAARLVTSIAASTGRLADARDLPFTAELLGDDGIPDPTKIGEAIDALIRERPHLADRRPRGDIGQGATAETAGVDLAGMLRARAG